jgi:hypothetical protein
LSSPAVLPPPTARLGREPFRVMVVVGFALYALALFLPAYQDLNGRNVVFGFATLPAVPLAVYILVTDFFTIVTAGALAFLLNVALPLSNIVLWIGVPLALNRSAFGRFVTVLMFLCAVVNVMPAFVVRLPLGYYMWVASFWCVAVGLALKRRETGTE